MKTSSKINVGVAAVAALALALPAGAFAHGSVWETTAKITNSVVGTGTLTISNAHAGRLPRRR